MQNTSSSKRFSPIPLRSPSPDTHNRSTLKATMSPDFGIKTKIFQKQQIEQSKKNFQLKQKQSGKNFSKDAFNIQLVESQGISGSSHGNHTSRALERQPNILNTSQSGQLAEKERELDRLKALVQSQRQEMASIKQKVNRSENQNTKLRENLNYERQNHLLLEKVITRYKNEENKQNQQLRQQNLILRNQINQLKNIKQSMKPISPIFNLEEEDYIHRLQTQNIQLQKELQSLKEHLDTLKRQWSQRTVDNSTVPKNSSARQIANQRPQISQFTETDQINEIHHLNRELAKRNNEVIDLKQQNARLSSLMKNRMAELEGKNKQIKQLKEKQLDQSSSIEYGQSAELAILKKQIERLRTIIQSNHLYRNEDSSNKSEDKSQFERHILELNERLQLFTNQIYELTEDKRHLQQELQRLNGSMKGSSISNKSEKKLSEEYGKVKQQLAVIKQKFKIVNQQLEHRQEIEAKLRQEINQLNKKIEKLEKEKRKEIQNVVQNEKKFASLQEKIELLTKQLQSKERSNSKSQEESQIQLKYKLFNTQNHLKQMVRQQRNYKQKQNNYIKQLNQIKKQLDATKQLLLRCKLPINGKKSTKAEKNIYLKQVEQYKKKNLDLCQTIINLKHEIQTLKRSIQQINQQNASLFKKSEQLSAVIKQFIDSESKSLNNSAIQEQSQSKQQDYSVSLENLKQTLGKIDTSIDQIRKKIALSLSKESS